MASTSSTILIRKRNEIYLVGYVSQQITGCKLPSNHQVLKSLFYNMRIVGLGIKEAARLTVLEVFVFWEKGRIPCQLLKHCIPKVEKLYNEWRDLQKSASRKSKTQEEKVLQFTSKFDDLFDIATKDALSRMTIEEDREFLTMQRKKGRPGSIGGVDMKTARADQRKAARIAKMEKLKQKASQKKEEEGKDQLELSSSSYNSDGSEIEEDTPKPMDLSDQFLQEAMTEGDVGTSSPDKKKRKHSRGSNEIVTEKLAMLLDRCNISDRNAVRIIAATAEGLNYDIEKLVLSRSAIRDRRLMYRSSRTKKIKDRFKNSDLVGAVLHWDGKLLPSLRQKESDERLAILVSSGDEEQLLGVPVLENSMGVTQSEAICEALEEWGVSKKIEAICFDTTPANTGRHSGTCTLVEKSLGRNLLYLACRHHTLELVLKAVFDIKMGSTTGPQPDVFKNFQNNWSNIDQSKYKVGVEDESVRNTVKNFEVEVSSFLLSQLKELQPRNDYLEFIELSLIFLGKISPNEVHFRAPGAFHHARWMAKAIYSLKIFLFREQFILSHRNLNAMRDICLFLIIIYVSMWFRAPNSVMAPNEDLKFIKNIIKYREIDQNISEKALGKYLNHLWYLNPELVCLSLFDQNVSKDEKTKMAGKILSYYNIDEPHDYDRIVRVRVSTGEAEKLFKEDIIGLDYFVSEQSLAFFKRFNILTDFLKLDPDAWLKNQEYLKCLAIVRKLKVVNDTAERGVKLIQDYNNSVTKDEEQKQYLLQVVAECRRLYPDESKATLSKPLSD